MVYNRLMSERANDLQLQAMQAARIEQARRLNPGEKAMDGVRLFDDACRITMDGIRAQHPHAGPDQVLRILRQRLLMREQWENR